MKEIKYLWKEESNFYSKWYLNQNKNNLSDLFSSSDRKHGDYNLMFTEKEYYNFVELGYIKDKYKKVSVGDEVC